MNKNRYLIASTLLLAAILTCVGSAGATDVYSDGSIQTVIEEIDGQVHEMLEYTMVLHNSTEKIADDETLDEDLRADAETVHVASHDLLYIAEDIQEQVEELKELGEDPEANKAKMGETIEKIREYLEDYIEILKPNHGLIDQILSDVPETHKAYAETASDAIYDLEGIASDIEENVEKLQKNLDGGEPSSEIQEVVKEVYESTSQLKKLTRKMNKPAHAIPGDTGSEIHVQFHRIEGPVGIIWEIVGDLQDLAEEPEENREEMRELVVEDLWEQLSGFGEAVDGMSDFVDEILSSDPDDANAQELQEIIEELTEVQYDVYMHVEELGAMVQDQIVWEYSRSLGALNPHRLENGNTLIAESIANRVIEVTPDKEIVWEYTDVGYPTDTQRLENGNTLIADRDNKRVIEVTPDKEVVWEFSIGEELKSLYGVRRLANGNTLIANQGNVSGGVFEIAPDKEVVWEYSGIEGASLGQRLENGNTLICDWGNHHVIEVTPDKGIVWEYSDLIGPYVTQRLENGNTLICDCMGGCVIEVTPDKEIVWKYGAVAMTNGAERLENGNTLISIFAENRVIEVGDGYPSKEQITLEELFESLAGDWRFEGSLMIGNDTIPFTGKRIVTMTSPTSADFVVEFTKGGVEETETGSVWWDSERGQLAIREGDEIGYANLTTDGYESREVLKDGVPEYGITEEVVAEGKVTIINDTTLDWTWTVDNMGGERLASAEMTFRRVSRSSTTLTAEIAPAISMTVPTTNVNFGKVGAGMTSANQVITAVNTGAGSAKVSAMMLDDGNDFYNESLRLNGGNIGGFSGVVPSDTSDFRYEYDIVANLVVPDWAGGKYDGTILLVAESES